MRISGTATLPADRSTVWRALNDPSVLVATIPGCRRLEALGDDAYEMSLSAGVGSITGVYDGRVRLSEQQEPGSFVLSAQGAGVPGTIDATVTVTLGESPGGGTDLSYDADATVGGMIGGVGQRMLVGVSQRMAAEFFGNVEAALATASASASASATDPSPSPDLPVGPASNPASPAAPPGSVFTAPGRPAAPPRRSGFAAGVGVGTAAALAGALVGAWIARRTSGRS